MWGWFLWQRDAATEIVSLQRPESKWIYPLSEDFSASRLLRLFVKFASGDTLLVCPDAPGRLSPLNDLKSHGFCNNESRTSQILEIIFGNQ
jgi:hypothetical protein